jgi:phospholipid/cholesterol/gamma-HCH transport system substrate-binding protein
MKSRLEWRVGLFVFIGLALLGVLLLQFSKGLTFFRPTKDLYLHSANVGGLKVRASVLVSGVQVGTVSAIHLAPDSKSVTITLRIFREYVIHKDARFVIEQSGFLGDQYVAIMPTENQGGVFENGDEAQAEAPFNLQEFTRSASGFIVRIDDTARKLNDSLVDVRRLLLNPETLTNLATSVANLRAASERAAAAMGTVNALVATNGPALAQSSTNLALFSERMSRFADSLNGVLATNSTEIHAAVKNIESSSAVLNSLLNDVQAGKGLAGTLLKNERLATSVAQMAENLSITSSNLNRLGVWGILWQHKPPRTNALAPQRLGTPKEQSE